MLEGISLPIAYCDIDGTVQQVLTGNILKGHLPSAPIINDVRDLASIIRQQPRSHIDIITASSPCSGISVAGKRKGLNHPDSALLWYVFEVIDAAKPKIVLLENTPSMTSELGFLSLHMSHRGYNMAWTNLPAFTAGSPQSRLRWWCLAWKKPAHLTQFESRIAKLPSSHHWLQELLPRTIRQRGLGHHARLKLLGNAIVPQCAILAYKFLLKELKHKKHPIATCYHKTGFIDNQNTCYKLCDPTLVTPDLGLVLKGNGLRIRKSLWPTPRARKTGSCAILTDRCSRDLGTALNFEITTTPGHTNPEWVEWLMGFPRGWTDFFR